MGLGFRVFLLMQWVVGFRVYVSELRFSFQRVSGFGARTSDNPGEACGPRSAGCGV